MFWTKVKVAAAALAAVAVVGTGVALSAAPAGEGTGGALRKEKDHAGREWQLEDWKEGTRPYEKDLAKREEAYRKKWGENWDGPVYGIGRQAGPRIMTPGDWKWEVVVTLPEELSKQLNEAPRSYKWGQIVPKVGVYAAGAGEVTGLYVIVLYGIVHYDPKSKKVTFIGSPTEAGNKDGLGEQARIESEYNARITLDNVTGRLFWRQGGLRYMEKLLSYRDKASGKECLLPALLDHQDMYKKVKGPSGGELEPVMKDGKRADPAFAVHTCTNLVRTCANANKDVVFPRLPFVRPLLTADGKGIWLVRRYNDRTKTMTLHLDNTALFDIETGKVVEALKLATPYPSLKYVQNGVGSHGGACVGIDGKIYFCQHCGCGGGPMRLLSIDTADGRLTYLYDSVLGVNLGGRPSPQWDGPADAQTISACSTHSQIQCPRTGAILNGGWDCSGLRRYHDGFLTTVLHTTSQAPVSTLRPGPNFSQKDCPTIDQGTGVGIAPNGDIYAPYTKGYPLRILRFYRTDWPKEQPEYGYGEKHMPRARLEELMLEYAKKYIANYAELSKIY